MYYFLGYLAIGFCFASLRLTTITEEMWQKKLESLPANQQDVQKDIPGFVSLFVFLFITLTWPVVLLSNIIFLLTQNNR
jgi:hypothetical protein